MLTTDLLFTFCVVFSSQEGEQSAQQLAETMDQLLRMAEKAHSSLEVAITDPVGAKVERPADLLKTYIEDLELIPTGKCDEAAQTRMQSAIGR